MAEQKKTAVIVVHGIGEQRPMDTLWNFLDAAWVEDSAMVETFNSVVYSKPSATETNFELRRVTTRGDKNTGRRFDFYEYYWAHKLQGNTLADVKGWLLSLFFRPKSAVPPEYHGYWRVGWLITALVAAAYLGWLGYSDRLGLFSGAVVLLAPIIAGLFTATFIPVVGDAARYLQPTPRNVEARQRIRADGVALLSQLQKSGKYDRVVMVGHSLGSVVAYDILTHAWAQLDRHKLQQQHEDNPDVMAALSALEAAGVDLIEASDSTNSGADMTALLTAWRNAQRHYRKTLAAQDEPLWLVSDLVTLGSPLGKADILLAKTVDTFQVRKDRREFPTCPPTYEYWGKDVRQFSFPRNAKARIPHHGAPFGPTVWSNVYFPTRGLLLGDPIAGAVGPHFGPGVQDTRLTNKGMRFQHLDYWLLGDDPVAQQAIEALRQALNLRDLDVKNTMPTADTTEPEGDAS